MAGLITLLLLLVYLIAFALTIYLVSLIARFVRAIERIADKYERT